MPSGWASVDGVAGDDLHVAAVAAEDATVEVGIGQADGIIGGKDDPLECIGEGVTGGVVVQRDVLAGGGEVPQHLVVGEAAGQGDVAAEIDVAFETEVQDDRVPRPIAGDRHEIPVVFAVGRDIEHPVGNSIDGVQLAGAFLDRLSPIDDEAAPQPGERAA